MAGFIPFKCPICLEVPSREIFQCKTGHSSCHSCVEKSPAKCPQCRIPFRSGKTRNLAMELALDACDLECLYKTEGCNQTFKRGELKEHIEACDYSRQNPLLCKMIGYPTCQFIPSRATRAEILEHFKANHDDDVWLHNKASWTGYRLQENAADCRRLILLSFDNSDTGPLVLIRRSYSAATKVTSWLCVMLWADRTKGVVPNLFADFAIESVDEAAPEIKWTLPVINITQAKIALEAKEFYTTPLLIEQYGRSLPGEDSRYIVVKTKLREETVKPKNEVRESTTDTDNSSRLATPRTNGAASSSSSSSFTSPSTSTIVIFRSATCGGCEESGIGGKKFKCLECADFDLCGKCVERNNHHPEHVLALVRNPRQSSTVNYIMTKLSTSGRQECISKRSSLVAESIQSHGICGGSCIYDFDDAGPVKCDACEMEPLCGHCYVCTQCDDFHLCSKCVEKGAHSHHIFVVLLNSAQHKKLQRWTESSSSSHPKILLTKKKPTQKGSNGVAEMNLKCKHCKKLIEGRLHSCLTCPEYYLCAVCVAEDQHSLSHLFAMARSTGQQALLDANRIEIVNKLEGKGNGTSTTGTKRKRTK